ncbi:hypothetical protein [Burkholderia oklahomensis]|nr:hypothetical protein [Burkholderia oklahomensis]AJX32288.1 hypothetical protein BG90_3506 [Burkholderia oklahomensis C6786]AOI46102.1 hypothetical protein WI23_10065 [Burkholderia oklahomensis C6786]MBI0361334.1 hypothetical protein [Burkholderia oklahomensis]SUW55197.1 Uncharacterised protein [Burkholderia oklahomensis]
MYAYIGAYDAEIAKEFEVKKMREAAQRIANRINRPVRGGMELMLTKHADYFSLLDIRPARLRRNSRIERLTPTISRRTRTRATTHRHYDKRKIKAANATE